MPSSSSTRYVLSGLIDCTSAPVPLATKGLHGVIVVSYAQGYGVIVIQGVEKKLKEAKVGDMVTVEKLKSIDEKNVS